MLLLVTSISHCPSSVYLNLLGKAKAKIILYYQIKRRALTWFAFDTVYALAPEVATRDFLGRFKQARRRVVCPVCKKGLRHRQYPIVRADVGLNTVTPKP